MSVSLVSERIQELLEAPLLTEEQAAIFFGSVFRKRPCLVLLVLSHLIRRLLLPELSTDAYNMALIYAFCFDGVHSCVFEGLAPILRVHATMLMRIVVRGGHVHFQDSKLSLAGFVGHRGALLLTVKALVSTPWLSRTDVGLLLQAPSVKRLRTEQERLVRQESFRKRTNFVTAAELIADLVQREYAPLRSDYAKLLHVARWHYDLLFGAFEDQGTVSAFRVFWFTTQRNSQRATHKFEQLGPRFKWRHYRDTMLLRTDRKRFYTAPKLVMDMMGHLHGFANSPAAQSFRFAQKHRGFLRSMLRISVAAMPLEQKLGELEKLVTTILNNNLRGVEISMPVSALKRCHDLLVLSGLIRQEVMGCSGTLLFLLGVSYGSNAQV